MKQPHAIVADDIRNVGFEYARCARDLIKFTDAGASTHFRRGGRPTLCRRLENDLSIRDDRWSESIALGNLAFIDEVRSGLGFKAAHRDILNFVGSYALREPGGRVRAQICRRN